MRQRAIARGLRLNEYGLFRVPGGNPQPGPASCRARRRRSLYGELGLALVPPELREDHGGVRGGERKTNCRG